MSTLPCTSSDPARAILGVVSDTTEPGSSEPYSSERDDVSSDDALLSRLRLIEDQPLADRADAFGQLHDELRTALEAGDR